MTATQEYAVVEYLNEIADSCGDNDDYLICIWVEREINGIRGMELPWKEIHNIVNKWMNG